MVVFTPLMIAKAALNVGKAVADSQRTAPDPSGDPGYASLKAPKKPETESEDEIRKQQKGQQKPEHDTPEAAKARRNGTTAEGSLDKDGRFNLGKGKANDYRGATLNYQDRDRNTRY